MKQHLKKLKRVNPSARILGIDVGRKYTGIAVSDKQLRVAKPLTTLIGKANFVEEKEDGSVEFRKEGKDSRSVLQKLRQMNVADLHENKDVFVELKRLIQKKNIKGIVVGYPLDYSGQPLFHCNYIERWVEHMWYLGIGKHVPVTLVNEHGTTMQAKV
jgi:RNase H-fold protein (predicted Holliday junction resolvase)